MTARDLADDEASGRRTVRIAAVAALGGLIFGYDVSVTNGAVAGLEDEFNAGNILLGFSAAGALLGAAAGAITAGRIADRLGRLSMMKLSAALFFVSAFGVGLATNIWGVIIFHIVGGIGIGIASAIVPAYIAEISPPHIRGRLGSLQQLAIVFGIFLALAVDWLPFHIAGGSRGELWLGLTAWRWTFFAEAVPAILYGVLVFTIPESPRHLIAVQRISEARRVLAMVLGERNVEITVQRISETLSHEHPPSWRDLRKPTGGLYGVVWVAIGLAVFQQLCGINVIFYYGNALWQAVGFGEDSSYLIAVVTSVVNVAITLVAIALIDKVGRRPLLLTGSALMALMLATMSVVFAIAPISDGKPKLDGALGPIALDRRQRVRHRVRSVMGADTVGAAGRNLSQPYSRCRCRTGRRRPMGGQFRDRVHLPDLAARARLRLWLLCLGCGPLICVRVAMGSRDQGRAPGRLALGAPRKRA